MQSDAPPSSPSLPPPPTGVLGCSRPLVHIPVRTHPASSSLSAFSRRKRWFHSLRVGLMKRKLSPILFKNLRISLDLIRGKGPSVSVSFPARCPSHSQPIAYWSHYFLHAFAIPYRKRLRVGATPLHHDRDATTSATATGAASTPNPCRCGSQRALTTLLSTSSTSATRRKLRATPSF